MNIEEASSDFGPSVGLGLKAGGMTRAQFSQMDLAALSERFGSLTMRGGRRGGGRLIRDESAFGLVEGDDDIF